MTKKNKSEGSKLSRTEVVTVRLDPQLRYGVEQASHKHRRTASSFMEWAAEQALSQVTVRNYRGEEQTVLDSHAACWDVEESDRSINKALLYPELLTHDEQRVWKLVSDNPYFWHSKAEPSGIPSRHPLIDRVNRFRVRQHWQTLNQVARGALGEDALPHVGLKVPPERKT